MDRAGFRFAPPTTAFDPGLRWVFARAFGHPAPAPPTEARADAVGRALVLGLAPRIVALHGGGERLRVEIGDAGLSRLRSAWAGVVAHGILVDAALAAAADAAGALDVGFAVLKGQAIARCGYAAPGARPSGDLDLLVPEDRVAPLQRELEARAFTPVGTGYEHQAPPLRHPGGAVVELHRVLPGVRLDPRRPRRSATFDQLAERGLLVPLPASEGTPIAGGCAPLRKVLATHALVHVLAQHGMAPGTYPGCLLVTDLVDLGCVGAAGTSLLANARRWIERELTTAEIDAALDLATALATDDPGLWAPERTTARRLLDHFVAGTLDPRYATSLKTRWHERPLSDRPRPVARAAAVLAALAPPRVATDGTAPRRAPRIPSLVARLGHLLRSWRAARAAGRSLR